MNFNNDFMHLSNVQAVLFPLHRFFFICWQQLLDFFQQSVVGKRIMMHYKITKDPICATNSTSETIFMFRFLIPYEIRKNALRIMETETTTIQLNAPNIPNYFPN